VEASTRDGRRKRIVWRNVVLRDAHGSVEGMLSIGADITDRVAAEAARDRALEELERLKEKLEEENILLKEEIGSVHGFTDIVGNSDGLRYVLHKVGQVAPSDATVLIQGETGVGKELVARAIHSASDRSTGAFIAVNCSALPPSLIESELFGHEQGAFTGADRRRLGRFELARGGTLLLDEVGDLPFEVQPKLLRVLQEGEFERVGGSTTLQTDARIISASNRDLSADVDAGKVRSDLYYRLAVFPITVPPLRDRPEDIPELVHHFVRQFAKARGIPVDEIPAMVMQQLEEFHWPGNVRELQNVIERAVLVSDGGVLRLAEPLTSPAGQLSPATSEAMDQSPTLEELERSYITQVLRQCGGQISGSGGAAEILGLHPNTLRSRMKKLGL
jgi:chemotaxis protein methyltransferase CheR